MGFSFLLKNQIKFIRNNGFDIKMVSDTFGADIKKIEENEHSPHIAISISRGFYPFKDLVTLFNLIKLFKKEKPIIVHSQSIKANLLAMLAAKVTKVPFRIQTMAGLISTKDNSFKSKILEKLEQVTYILSTHVWPNSTSSYNYLIKNKLCNPNKLAVIANGSSNGIDLKEFNKLNISDESKNEVKQKIEFDSNKFYFLFLGRFVKDKGIQDLIKAFTLLQKKYSTIELLIIGVQDKAVAQIDDEVLAEINNNKSIKVIGEVPRVTDYFDVANCFVFPSYREGFPTVLLEAGAMECPIIASNIIGNIDMIRNNETGRLFQVKNIKALEECMEHAINNKELSVKFADKFLSEIKEKYEQSIVQKALVIKYNDLILNCETKIS